MLYSGRCRIRQRRFWNGKRARTMLEAGFGRRTLRHRAPAFEIAAVDDASQTGQRRQSIRHRPAS